MVGIQAYATGAVTAFVLAGQAAGVVVGRTTGVQSKYSTWMASSIMARSQGIRTGNGGVSELLQCGFTQRALLAATAQYPEDTEFVPRARDYIRNSALSVIPSVSNASYDAVSWPMDRLSNGNALLILSDSSDSEAASFRTAADTLRESINLNPRTYEDGLWYYHYPQQSYLDGMFSLAPFYTIYATHYAATSNNTASLDDMLHQIELLWNHTYKADSGLLVHGYDASKAASWADPVTGASPHVWGRSLGWYSIALVETLEVLPTSPQIPTKYREYLLKKWRSLAGALIDHVDPTTGGWWQLLDQPGREGNYIESSGSSMFTYALLKSARLGYLGSNATLASKAVETGVRAHKYITDTFVIHQANGTLEWNGTVAVCSLNSTASYDYYIHQPILFNSVLGSAAYVFASLETERLGGQ
ncbi:Six-hairpin glycosidase-like protein [Hypoxylon trugodes]|uniref:Six-hairpin glycosidase-like protein n=1 Tax=Hypoxylon trugodes TaxID=326681 RepID=UPI002194F5C7|nr:Six-hairpin glycosidase-like protein [Hypoxylon trugodes]KAI1392167.1 Six-hairpin glycosidase-like protein [Hypoxylon trugodes]